MILSTHYELDVFYQHVVSARRGALPDEPIYFLFLSGGWEQLAKTYLRSEGKMFEE